MNFLQLRDYQIDCLQRLHESFSSGRRRLLVSLPTGTGKTVIFAQLPRSFGMKKRLLVVAHREELICQAHDKFRAVDPKLSVGIEQGDQRAPQDTRVVVASVATLSYGGGVRLANLNPEEFDMVVVDEAHHAVAPTYQAILAHFGLLDASPERRLVGFTATPTRADGKGLHEVFEEVAFSRTLEQMIHAGHLTSIVGWRVTTAVDLDAVEVRNGDFVEEDLARVVNVVDRNALLVRSYQELAAGRRTLVFCANVAHTKTIAELFEQHGIRAAAVWGGLPRDQRRKTLYQFGRGEIDVLTNCNVLTEGFDEPRLDCILMARPTRSLLMYSQMIGRGTRLHPEKSDLLVIDVADNSRRHRLASLTSLFELPPDFNLKGQDVLDVVKQVQKISQQAPWVDLTPPGVNYICACVQLSPGITQICSPDELDLLAERVDLFRFQSPPEIRSITSLAWTSCPGGAYLLPIPGGDTVRIQKDLLDHWAVSFQAGVSGCTDQKLGQGADLPHAVRIAEQFVVRHFKHVRLMVDTRSRWRKQPPTRSQLALFEEHGIPVPPTLTRGEASWVISHLLANVRLEGSTFVSSKIPQAGHLTPCR